MNSSEFILAIDQGTTNTKVLLVDNAGRIIHSASRPVDISFPHTGWVEQDALQIWDSVNEALKECLATLSKKNISGIAITNQRETALTWERDTGKPAGPVITWQCRRTSEFCNRLNQEELGPLIQQRTGLPIDPLFSASKVRWLLDNVNDGQRRAENGALCAGTVDSWVLWNLTGGASHCCDVSNASRTQLLNLKTGAWDSSLLDIFSIPLAILPEIRQSSGYFGETRGVNTLPDGIPIVSMIGDSHAALFGQCGFQQGSVKATYGTGSSLMSPLQNPSLSSKGIATTVAWGIENDITYALEGNISVTGSAVQWYANLLGYNNPADAAMLATEVESAEGVFIVPAFVGLGAPHWNEDARGLITGITRGTTASHIARAVIESIAFQIRDVFDAMSSEAGTDLHLLLADGGGSRNDFLMQLQADILGFPVLRNNAGEISALGAAYLAGLHLGTWQNVEELTTLPRSLDQFEPKWTATERENAYDGWKNAVARTIYNPN